MLKESPALSDPPYDPYHIDRICYIHNFKNNFLFEVMKARNLLL